MQRENPNVLPSAQEGGAAPRIEAIELPPYPVFDQAALEADGIKVVNFWASWCAPCRAEHPNIVALGEEFPVYGVNRDITFEQARAFYGRLGFTTASGFPDANTQAMARAIGVQTPTDYDGSQGGEAAPAVWEDPEGFKAAIEQWQDATTAAMVADPQDLETAKPIVGAVLKNCKGCHDSYRIEDE